MKRRMFLKAAAGVAATSALNVCAQEAPSLEIRTLGTGAADFDWSKYGQPECTRGSCTTLLGGRVLVDCGRTGYRSIKRFGVNPATIEDLIFTHAHGDHCFPQEINALIAARSSASPKLRIWAVREILDLLRPSLNGGAELHQVETGFQFKLPNGWNVLPLPANHELGTGSPAGPGTEPRRAQHYVFETPRGNILYALDGAWMLKHARMLIGKRKLDFIVWDATMSTQLDDFRIFEHCNLHMIEQMMGQLRRTGAVHDGTKVVLSHMARTLWPKTHEECVKLLPVASWNVSRDGDVFTL